MIWHFSRQFINHFQPGFRVMKVQLREFGEQGRDGFVLCWSGHPMDPYQQTLALFIGFDVRRRNKEFANECTRIRLFAQMRAQKSDECGFRAIGDHLDGVGQHFREGQKLLRALVFGERAYTDFPFGFPPLEA